MGRAHGSKRHLLTIREHGHNSRVVNMGNVFQTPVNTSRIHACTKHLLTTWWIPLNHLCAVVMQLVVKLLWPFVIMFVIIIIIIDRPQSLVHQLWVDSSQVTSAVPSLPSVISTSPCLTWLAADINQQINRFTAIMQINLCKPTPPVKNWKICCSQVLLPACPCLWQQGSCNSYPLAFIISHAAGHQPIAAPHMSSSLTFPMRNLLPLYTMTKWNIVAPPGEHIGNLWLLAAAWHSHRYFQCHKPQDQGKTWCYLQNPKYITYSTDVRGRSSHGPT